jgi:hypothetical protein
MVEKFKMSGFARPEKGNTLLSDKTLCPLIRKALLHFKDICNMPEMFPFVTLSNRLSPAPQHIARPVDT